MGNVYIMCTFANALAKLVMKMRLAQLDSAKLNYYVAQSSLAIISLMRLGTTEGAPSKLDPVSIQRLQYHLRQINDPSLETASASLRISEESFQSHLSFSKAHSLSVQSKAHPIDTVQTQIDDMINFRQLKSATVAMTQLDIEDEEVTLYCICV
jgi:hypothetical protein